MLIRQNVAVAIRRNLFLLWSQRSVVDIKRHKYIISNLFYKQTHCTRAGSRQRADKQTKGQGNWSRSTSPSFPSDLWEPWTAWSNFQNRNDFKQSELLLELLSLSVRRARKWKWGIVYNPIIQASRWHALVCGLFMLLVAKEFLGCAWVLASYADALWGSSRVPVPQPSADLTGKNVDQSQQTSRSGKSTFDLEKFRAWLSSSKDQKGLMKGEELTVLEQTTQLTHKRSCYRLPSQSHWKKLPRRLNLPMKVGFPTKQ